MRKLLIKYIGLAKLIYSSTATADTRYHIYARSVITI